MKPNEPASSLSCQK